MPDNFSPASPPSAARTAGPARPESPSETRLESLTIEVTTACDLRCANCFALAALPNKSGMTFEEAEYAAREGRAAGFRRLHLTGGEPSIWKPFFPLIDAAFALGYEQIFFNTHGGFLDARFCERLAKYGDRMRLSISLNGPALLHDAVRGAGTHERAVSGLRAALQAGLHVLIFTVVGRELLPELPAFARTLHEEFPKIAGLALIPLHRVAEDYYDVDDDLLGPSDFAALVSMVAALSLSRLRIRIQNQALANAVAAAQGISFFPDVPPMARYGRLTILRDGKITVAHSSRAALNQSETETQVKGLHATDAPGKAFRLAPGAIQRIVKNPRYARQPAAGECADCEFNTLCTTSGNPGPPTVEYDRPESPDRNAPYCRRTLRWVYARRTGLESP
ncbi:MAG: radical SAM protein [Leptospirales bacterium]|jgi:MoaA/NifB/PqqE/SkfB family radical SAM enzyme